MPTRQKTSNASKSVRSGAGIAGASGGTIIALVANNLPPSNGWRPWLILIAPSVSVAIGGVVIWANRILEEYLNNKRKRILFERLKKTIQTALASPNTSDTHKSELRAQLEKIEKLQFESDFELLVKEWR
jgi:hypothetical protein